MINVSQFRELIVRPTLQQIGLYSTAAENLMVGTALVESKLTYLKQLGRGPALSVFQIEPVTHTDLWETFLPYRPDLRDKVNELLSQSAIFSNNKLGDLVGNIPYACAMARLVYYRRPEPLPDAEDIIGLANYWKKHYNTEMGRGNPLKFYDLYNTYAR
jgi:hypothetical protein